MPKNKISDLRDHCFAALERLNDETIKGDKLQQEIERAEAISKVAQTIVNAAKVEVDFYKASGSTSSKTSMISIDGPQEEKDKF